MDKKEKTLCLRIINELIRSYSQINMAPPCGISEVNFDETVLTPSWLVDIKQDFIIGKYEKLVDVIEKIKTILVDCLRSMGPYFTALCRILLHEQILQYEIQKLPRSMKNKFKTNNQKKAKGKPKSTRLAMKRRMDQRYFSIQSTLINAVFEEQDKQQRKTKYSTTADIKKKVATSEPKTNEMIAISTLISKISGNKQKVSEDNVDINKETPSMVKSLRTSRRKPNMSIKISSQTVATKTKDAGTEKSQNCSSEDITKLRRAPHLRQLPTLARDVSQNKELSSAKGPEKIKLGKRKKLPMTENNEETDDELRATKDSSIRDESSSTVEGEPKIKQKRVTGSRIGQRLQNLIGKKKPPTKLPTASNTQSNQETSESSSRNTCLPTTTRTLRTSTPRKQRGPITLEEIVTSLTGAESVNDAFMVSPLEEVEVEDAVLEMQQTMPMDTPQVVDGEAMEVEITKELPRKKRSSKFQQKGNQLMGIQEEETSVQDNDDNQVSTTRNGKNPQEESVECRLREAVLKSIGNNLQTSEESQENITTKKSSQSSKQRDDGPNMNNSIEEIQLLHHNRLIDEKEDDEELKVVKVVTKHTYKTISRKLLRLLDQVHPEDPEVTVEKVIVDEVIPDNRQLLPKLPLQKSPEEADQSNCKRRKSSCGKSMTLSYLKNSAKNAKKNSNTAKKPQVAVQAEESPASNSNCSILTEEGNMMIPCEESHPSESINMAIDDSVIREAEEWLTNELAPADTTLEDLTHIPEIPEISCFLHACQKALRLPFFTHFEFELSLIIPHASCLMATVVTALLSGAPSSKETKTCYPLPYLQWNRKLTARLSFWFLIYKRLKDSTKVQDLLGLEPIFWYILGNKRNPLTLKPFHLLPIHERVMILKGLCDHLLHVSKRIQSALISSTRGGREGMWLGEDIQGQKYLYIPIFLRDCFGNLRVYRTNKSSTFVQEEPFLETESIGLPQDLASSAGKAIDENDKPKEEKGLSNMNLLMDKTFSLAADNAEKLNALLATISSPFEEDELLEAEKKLGSKVVIKEEIIDQEAIKQEENDPSVELPSSKENIDSRNEQLLLAVKLKSLAKTVSCKETLLLKTRDVALVKLYMEWNEFNKDGFCVIEKAVASDKKYRRRRNEKRLQMKRKDQQDDNFEGPAHIKCGRQLLPLRPSLSRKAKSKAGSLMQEEETQPSRKEIISEMEERALLGSSNLNKEDMKWDISLWADDDSDDDQPRHLEVEESIWHGYAAIQNEAAAVARQPSLGIPDTSHYSSITKNSSGIVKTYAKLDSFTTQKNQTMVGVPPGQNVKIEPVVLIGESSKDSQDKLKTLYQKFKNRKLKSFKIKIKKEDVDSFIHSNKPELLTDLVRKKIADKQCNTKAGKSQMALCQNRESHDKTNRNRSVGSSTSSMKDLSEIEEANPPLSVTENILNSITRGKQPSNCGSLDLPTDTSIPGLFKSTTLNVVQLQMPFPEGGGGAKSYSKPEIDKVTQFVLKAVNDINRNSSTPQEIEKSTAHSDNQNSTCGGDDIEILSSPFDQRGKPGQASGLTDMINKDQHSAAQSSETHEDSAPGVVEPKSQTHICQSQSSGFKPFLLKSRNSKGTTALNNGDA
ncbi:uncharacterized protein LOC124166923 [Ischnura elegans]|uniref:uncharacterized protein LOC124166923 n=1 Tax=Ischnura elegans TaxID=197161 RepID=UPI001ED87A44|nr:uncharacterized protein LOC124166923 [Ischnura elegans]